MNAATIELRGIHKSYGAEKVLENLDLTMDKGGFTVLLGPSGCGKSTILRLIAGLEQAAAGDVLIDGQSVRGVEPGDRGIAMVFQNYALYPTMSVRENIEYGLRNNGVPKAERDRRIAEIAETVGLGDYLRKKPQFLSGGQRQRVALARAMVKQPRIFLMDEPLSNLDAKLRGQLRKDLIELHRRLGSTFVYVTHDQIEAMSLGTKVILLEKGRVRQAGSPEEIYAKPANLFSARFIGTPPLNVVDAGAIPAPLPPGTRHVGFRPEKAAIAGPADAVPAGAVAFAGDLVTREMLGSEALYQVNGPGWKLQAKLYDRRQVPYGPAAIHVAKRDVFCFGDDGSLIEAALPGAESTPWSLP